MEDNAETEGSIRTLNNTSPQLNSSEYIILIDENCEIINFENQSDFNGLPDKVDKENVHFKIILSE